MNPTVGGVYGNVVRDNIADGNGTNKAPPQFGGGGSGSGIGLFGSGPGSAVYNNLIVDNEASGNGLAGLAITRFVDVAHAAVASLAQNFVAHAERGERSGAE